MEKIAFSTAAFDAFINSASAENKKAVSQIIKKIGGIKAFLSAYGKTNKKQFAELALYADTFRGIIECLRDGQKTRLAGFAVKSRKDQPFFICLVNLGILSHAGDIRVGVKSFDGNAETLEAKFEHFIAASLQSVKAAREAARLARESDSSEAEAQKAEAEAETEAATADAEPSFGQIMASDAEKLISYIAADTLPLEYLEKIAAAIAHNARYAAAMKQAEAEAQAAEAEAEAKAEARVEAPKADAKPKRQKRQTAEA